jgi:DNA-binding transcriptional LysR family regulator
VVCRVASLDEMLALAAGGVGITVLPDYFIAPALASGEIDVIRPRPQGRRAATAKNAILLAQRHGAIVSARIRVLREALLAAA